jgi:hypothetical protein
LKEEIQIAITVSVHQLRARGVEPADEGKIQWLAGGVANRKRNDDLAKGWSRRSGTVALTGTTGACQDAEQRDELTVCQSG